MAADCPAAPLQVVTFGFLASFSHDRSRSLELTENLAVVLSRDAIQEFPIMVRKPIVNPTLDNKWRRWNPHHIATPIAQSQSMLQYRRRLPCRNNLLVDFVLRQATSMYDPTNPSPVHILVSRGYSSAGARPRLEHYFKKEDVFDASGRKGKFHAC
jgi:hypothetical protein